MQILRLPGNLHAIDLSHGDTMRLYRVTCALTGRWVYRTQNLTKSPHAFQLVIDQEFVSADPFTRNEPTLVPARTLLGQSL